jgi:predicted DNA-binding protein with PD1-like motif
MESMAFNVKRIHIVRIDPGEDVLCSLKDFLQKADMRQGIVVGGYGTLAAHHLHWVIHNRIPSENIFRRAEAGIEILGMSGLVVDGEPHIHVTLATPNGAYGGHMEEGCKAYVLCEVFVAEIQGGRLSRRRVAVAVPGMGEGTVPRLSSSER